MQPEASRPRPPPLFEPLVASSPGRNGCRALGYEVYREQSNGRKLLLGMEVAEACLSRGAGKALPLRRSTLEMPLSCVVHHNRSDGTTPSEAKTRYERWSLEGCNSEGTTA
ncbi:hypothetical protein IMZ48_37025 [Candidatus Bathyarchaeota archaeon]|nr:hypothetical protein [Candidatus Bathyarchaeota archaeon]